jgi:hypothetical protein
MLLAGLFAAVLFLGLIITDWFHFTSLTAPASTYGCGIARTDDHLPVPTNTLELDRFDRNGLLRLPHGVARFFRDDWRILLRPQYRLFSLGFRTAWPLKVTIELERDGTATRVRCTKRVPWSSALLTVAWFLVVGGGTISFLVSFVSNGGFASLSGVLMGLGITGLGVLVLAFGLIVVILAYRLEDDRLSQVYRELLIALTAGQSP